MTHPSESELALYASGDLTWFKRRRTDQHLSYCGVCQTSVSNYSELRLLAGDFPVTVTNQWKRLETEIAANVSLGLSAGECVTPRLAGTSRAWQSSWNYGATRRLIAACAVLVTAAGVGYVIQHPPALALTPATISGSILEASDKGLQVHEGSQTLRLLNTSGNHVSNSVGSRGELGTSYVDTGGYVTISQVYGQ